MADQLHQQHLGACRTAFRGAPEACADVLLVGEDNPLSAAPEHALYCAPDGCAGQRLQEKILGLRRSTYLALWRTNLCVGGWSSRAARARALALADGSAPWSVVVLLGRKVAEANGQVLGEVLDPLEIGELVSIFERGRDPHDQYAMKSIRFVALPHPSGRNLFWNNQRAPGTARKLLSEAAPGVPWGELLHEVA